MKRLLLLPFLFITVLSFGQYEDNNCINIANPTFSVWTELKATDAYPQIIKKNNLFYVRSASEVYTSPNIDGPWTSLNFQTQTGLTGNGSVRTLEVLNNGDIIVSTPDNGIYIYTGGTWTGIGLSGGGTNGLFVVELLNDRLLAMRAGFLRDLYITDDNGVSWTNVTNSNVDWFDITIADNNDIFVCDGVGGLIKSSDNGASFQSLNSLLGTSKVNSITKGCAGYLYALTDIGIQRSIDNGNTWSFLFQTPVTTLNAHFSNFLVTTEGNFLFHDGTAMEFLFSNDGGNSWNDVLDYPGDLSLISKVKEIDGNIVVCALDGVWAKSMFNSTYCTDTTEVFDTTFVTIYDTTEVFDTTFVTIYDTITYYDTVLVSVTDTLIIDVSLTGVTPPNNTNTILVYPNPSNDIVIIDNGDYLSMSGYTLKIINSLGQEVFNSIINVPQFQIPVSVLGSVGLYYIQVFDDNSSLLETKKLILN